MDDKHISGYKGGPSRMDPPSQQSSPNHYSWHIYKLEKNTSIIQYGRYYFSRVVPFHQTLTVMSVADSSVSQMLATSTVVGCRASKIGNASEATTTTADVDGGKPEGDEVFKRNKCVWFENKLGLTKYRRDPKNEERAECNAYIRINSQILRSSHQIPAPEIYQFVKKLHHLVAPGFRLDKRDGTATETTKREEEHLKIFRNWSACTDFSVQVFPKTPTVFWLDLECMECKRGEGAVRKHLRSREIIKTVVAALRTSEKTLSKIDSKHLLLYVTRGRTCGMHIFFPDIVCESVDEIGDLWDSINKCLAASGQTAATVDTGCSALPLPLSRYHSGLTRVEISLTGEDVTIVSYQLTKPTVRDFARIANFHHMVADVLKLQKPTPPSSVVDSTCTSDLSKVSNKRKHDDSIQQDERSTHDVIAKKRKQPSNVCLSSAVLQNINTDLDARSEDIPLESTKGEEKCAESTVEGIDTVDSQQQPPPPTVTSETVTVSSDEETKHEEDRNTVVRAEYYCEERESSVSSTPSKRLVQSDIRSVCAKVKKRPHTVLSRVESVAVSDSKRSRLSKVVDRKDGGSMLSEPSCSLQSKMSTWFANNETEPNTRCDKDDTASSLACRGQASSVKTCNTAVDSSVFTIEDNEEGGPRETPHHTRVSVETSDVKKLLLPADEKNRPPPTTTTTLPKATPQTGLWTCSTQSVRDLYVADDSVPNDAQLPKLYFDVRRTKEERDDRTTKEAFRKNMEIPFADNRHNRVHQTDIQLLLSNFNSELDFYVSTMNNAVPLTNGGGLRTKHGSSLNASRDSCPTALFPQNIPHVLYSEDFVSQREWVTVLVRYFDEYLNEAAFLHVMSRVLQHDDNVKTNMNVSSRREIHKCVNNCLARFKNDTIEFQRKLDVVHHGKATNVRKHPYGEKCTIVVGLIAVCSLAFKMVTPIFTDLAKICHLLLSNNQQTLHTLNQSTMSTTTGSDYSFDSLDEDPLLDVSASQVDAQNHTADCAGIEEDETEETGCKPRSRGKKNVPANIGNYHSIIASVLRWNYDALDVQTRWCLFFYYYHVHTDGLTRITNEVVHGGVMMAAVLHAYFEESAGKRPVSVSLVCARACRIDRELTRPDDPEDEDEEKRLMPPPNGRGKQLNNRKKGTGGKAASSEAKKEAYEKRPEDAKKAQRKIQEGRGDGRDKEEEGNNSGGGGGGGAGEKSTTSSNSYGTSFSCVIGMIIRRYLRPVAFDESVVLYTETGYEQCQNELSGFFSLDKERKKLVMDIFKRETMKYVMPHGDLLMYNTDVLGTVHRRSSCTSNLVLNIFENMYGGCMTYLTRRFNNNLKLFHRFNGDAYRLVVECRHAMIELIQSIELSYMNLILRQPIVPPILETDPMVRDMFMSSGEIMKGAFVSLNAMDYVRAINMFTRHPRFSQENYHQAESFLDKLITKTDLHKDVQQHIDEDACQRFRTTYLFFLLYIFEVLYKIRHVYNRDRTYNVSIERLSWDMDVRLLLKLFFGAREFKMPRGLSPETLLRLDMTKDVYEEATAAGEDDFQTDAENNAAAAGRCINTRPLICTTLPDKMSRMMELFGKKGIVVMKSYAPLNSEHQQQATSIETDYKCGVAADEEFEDNLSDVTSVEEGEGVGGEGAGGGSGPSYVEQDQEFLKMAQARLEEVLYSSGTWYENCRVRVKATRARDKDKNGGGAEKKTGELEMSMDTRSMDTFLRTQLRVNIDNGRLEHVQRAVRENKDFAFCTLLPLRAKTMALVLASHATKRLTDDVAADFVRKEYYLERSGVIRLTKGEEPDRGGEEEDDGRPDLEWGKVWKRLLVGRMGLLKFGRLLADTYFPDNYFIGLQPEKMYDALFDYMTARTKYTTFHALQNHSWIKDVCAALNYLLVMNAYDPELVELCLRLFLGLEWPGQWAKRIFVWKSNSNAGKSVLFENVIGKAFDQSTCINDPKGGKENAPEKSEYYKNFVLMINEFTSASACELKKLCSTSSYKFRMNFGNQMIQAFMVGKMVFNCNTLPLTTDHATIQRVALVPLPFWFQKRQSVVDSMLNWTLGQSPTGEYERNFRRNVSTILSEKERHFFITNQNTKGEEDLFNKRNETLLQTSGEHNDRSARASVFMVQNKTSQMYMSNPPPTNSIISGVVIITKYFSRFRFFNNIKEPVDYSVLPTACTAAAQEWQRISQPYFDWKDRYRVQKDYTARTKISTIHASLNHFAKNYSKNVSFFDLRQFFEWDFAEQKIPYYNAKEDEYNVTLDPFQD